MMANTFNSDKLWPSLSLIMLGLLANDRPCLLVTSCRDPVQRRFCCQGWNIIVSFCATDQQFPPEVWKTNRADIPFEHYSDCQASVTGFNESSYLGSFSVPIKSVPTKHTEMNGDSCVAEAMMFEL